MNEKKILLSSIIRRERKSLKKSKDFLSDFVITNININISTSKHFIQGYTISKTIHFNSNNTDIINNAVTIKIDTAREVIECYMLDKMDNLSLFEQRISIIEVLRVNRFCDSKIYSRI